MEEHVKLVREVLRRLLDNELYVKSSKCEFHTSRLTYLGYVISSEGIEMDPAKVQGVLEWERPRTRRQMQRFIGFANFYRKFIPNISQILLPLTDLLKIDKTKSKEEKEKLKKPGTPLAWTDQCTEAFERLKNAFASEPVLKHPDVSKPFVVQVDASDTALGGVLLQKNEEGELQPCAYLSYKFNETERNWPVWEKEAAAVMHALEHWRHFLDGAKEPFEVWTDHKNLEALRTQRKLSPKQVRWAKFFSEFNFKLTYLPGEKNFLADALSRHWHSAPKKPQIVGTPFTQQQLGLAVTTRAQAKKALPNVGRTIPEVEEPMLPWFSEAKDDSWVKENAQLVIWENNLPLVKGKIYVPESAREKVLQQVHASRAAGHLGFLKTLHLLKRQFWWPGLKKDVESFIKECHTCLQMKRAGGKPKGLLKPLETPNQPWTDIAMDFIVDLPCSKGKTVVWVVTDLFSKQVHFVACKDVPTAPQLADLFLQHVYRLHGIPKKIVSDRGAQFTSKFWKSFLKMLGTEPALSSAHHAATDGQTERANQVLEQYLRCFINYQQNDWVSLLPHAEYCYNNSVHSSSGRSPFQTVYGREFKPFPLLHPQEDAPTSQKEWGEKIAQAWPQLVKALDGAKADYKRFADRKRDPAPNYQVGDKVYLSTKFLRSHQPCKKLGPKYIGPFPIKRIVNEVAVELELPKMYRAVHAVFHVSLLKPAPAVVKWHPTFKPPEPIMLDGQQHFEIAEVLDAKRLKGQLLFLVKWKHFPSGYNEWVLASNVKAKRLIAEFYEKNPSKPKPSAGEGM